MLHTPPHISHKQYAVLHFAKPKGSKALRKLGQHIDRQQISSNVDARRTRYNQTYLDQDNQAPLAPLLDGTIDPTQKEQNHDYIAPHTSLPEAIAQHIEAGYTVKNQDGSLRAIRKDAVKAVFAILTGSHLRMKAIEQDPVLFQQWITANCAFAKREFGAANIVRMTLHRDEKTPHFHLVFVPITPDGRLSAEYYIGSKAELRALQDRYAAAMAPFLLQRGEQIEFTQAQHVDIDTFRREQSSLLFQEHALLKQITAKNIFSLDKIKSALTRALQSKQYQVANAHVELAKKTNLLQALLQRKGAQALTLQLKTQARLQYLAQGIVMPTFLVQHLGYQQVGSGLDGCITLNSTQEDLPDLVCQQVFTGDWLYRLVPPREGSGNLAHFLHHEAQWDWNRIFALTSTSEAAQYVTTHHKAPKIHLPAITPEVQAQWQARAEHKLHSCTAQADGGWLKQVGIRPNTLQGLTGWRASGHEAVFPLYRVAEDGIHLQSTISYRTDAHTGQPTHRLLWQGKTPGSKGLSILQASQSPTQLVLCSTPLDALCYRQLQLADIAQALQQAQQAGNRSQITAIQQQLSIARDKTQYIATCGALSIGQRAALEIYFAQAAAQGRQVTLALSHDRLGQCTVKRLRDQLFAAGVWHQVVWNKAVSWQVQLQDKPHLGIASEKLPRLTMPCKPSLSTINALKTLLPAPLRRCTSPLPKITIPLPKITIPLPSSSWLSPASTST